jgi:hypothetical protein
MVCAEYDLSTEYDRNKRLFYVTKIAIQLICNEEKNEQYAAAYLSFCPFRDDCGK